MVSTNLQSTVLRSWNIIQVTGKDALSFLQGQVTVKLEDIDDTHFKLSGYCNLKGRLHGLFFITKTPAGYWLVLPSSISSHMIATLKKYALFSKVTISNLQDSHQILGCNSNSSHQPAWVCSQEHNLQVLNLPGQNRLFVGEQASIESFKEKHASNNSELTETQWQALMIEAGIPLIYEQTIEQFLPHHLNGKALGMLNFEKGCYLGQEIIARMEYKGQIKKHLYRAQCTTTEEIPPGSSVVNDADKIVGHLLYSANIDSKYHLLLCLDSTLTSTDIALNLSSKPAIDQLSKVE